MNEIIWFNLTLDCLDCLLINFANFHSLLLLSIWKLKMKLLAFFCDQLNQRGLSVRWLESLLGLFIDSLHIVMCSTPTRAHVVSSRSVCWQTSKFRSDNIFAVLSIHIYFLTPPCPLLSRSCANTTKTKRFIFLLDALLSQSRRKITELARAFGWRHVYEFPSQAQIRRFSSFHN